MAMAPKRQRLILSIGAVAAVIIAGLIATYALQSQASFYLTPTEAKAQSVAPGRGVRLGGMVERGSLVRAGDGLDLSFRLTDGTTALPVRYRGIVPDLFAEGAGAVADGHFAPDGVFVATHILAKHDENYVPPQMTRAIEQQAARRASDAPRP